MGLYSGVLKLSEGFLRLRFGGLIFGRAYFLRDLLLEFYGYLKRVKFLQLAHIVTMKKGQCHGADKVSLKRG